VIVHVKKRRLPSELVTPDDGARTSSIAWMRRLTSAGSGLGAYLASTSADRLSTPRPL